MLKTQEELDLIKSALAATHKPIYTIVVPLDDEETEFATIFLKKVDRQILSAIQKVITGSDILKAVEIFLKNTYIGGDDIALVTDNFDALRATQDVVFELLASKKATLKKN